MLYTLLSSDGVFLGNAMSNPEDLSLSAQSASSTQIVLFNSISGYTTTLTGSGFVLDPNGSPVGGTITNISVSSGGQVIGTVSQISWNLVEFDNAYEQANFDNLAPYASLLNASAPITIDATAATASIDFEDTFGTLSNLVTVGITYLSSDFRDNTLGSAGNDTFVLSGNILRTEMLAEGTAGNDTYDFSDATNVSFVQIDYDQDYSPTRFSIDATLNSITNTGTVVAGSGQAGSWTDTFVDVASILGSGGLAISGTEMADTLNATLGYHDWLYFVGGTGNDTITANISSGGTLRLNYRYGATEDPTQGIVADLVAGTIVDGHGDTDALNISNAGRFEIRGTDFNDYVTGSNASESFIGERGNDTFDGAGGTDRVRYDRSGVDAVNVDLAAQTASGMWDSIAFTDTLISVEVIIGSRTGNDTISGASGDEVLDGYGGNDIIDGRGGNDVIYGYDGNDSLIGGLGDDSLRGEDGNDTLRGG
ncbi:MAG: hypothetical protein MK098_15580, partial [Marinovum sp.]|nr:hypothetical protein [Marinovum sp.]